MPDFTFRHGDPITIDYTPSSGNVSAGDGVILPTIVANTTAAGLTVGVAHKDITNNVLGALAAGGGVYDAMVASNYAAYTKVYKPAGNAILTTTSTNNAQFGFTIEDSAAANSTVKVLHWPYA